MVERNAEGEEQSLRTEAATSRDFGYLLRFSGNSHDAARKRRLFDPPGERPHYRVYERHERALAPCLPVMPRGEESFLEKTTLDILGEAG